MVNVVCLSEPRSSRAIFKPCTKWKYHPLCSYTGEYGIKGADLMSEGAQVPFYKDGAYH